MVDNPAGAAPDWQPTLTGQLVLLRPLRANDYAELARAGSDPLIWEQHPERERWKPELFRKYFEGAMASGAAFAVIDRASGRIVGSTRFYQYEPEHRRVSLGYTFVARECWGQGHNSEMKRLVLAHAFRYVDEVELHIGENNHRSRKATEKLGAKLVEVRAGDYLLSDGSRWSSAIYRLRRPD